LIHISTEQKNTTTRILIALWRSSKLPTLDVTWIGELLFMFAIAINIKELYFQLKNFIFS